jgi:hypothetical protein
MCLSTGPEGLPRVSNLTRLTAVTLLALPLVAWLAIRSWNPEERRGATMPASPLLTDASIEALCRPPDDEDIVRWDKEPQEKAALIAAIKGTPEGERVIRIRQMQASEVIVVEAGGKFKTSIPRWIVPWALGNSGPGNGSDPRSPEDLS